jgi:hypothetical protein
MSFVGTDKDLTDGIANMDLGDEDEASPTNRTKGLKYMSQLVSAPSSFLICQVLTVI